MGPVLRLLRVYSPKELRTTVFLSCGRVESTLRMGRHANPGAPGSAGKELVEAHAGEPALVEQREKPRQGTDRRGLEVVVLRRIVEHDDRAVGECSADALEHGLGTSTSHAVVAARRPADERDTRPPRAGYGRETRVAEGRAEELRPHAGGGLDGILGADDLVADPPGHAKGVQAIVAITVHADGVAGVVNGAHDGGMPAHLLAQHEE